MNRKKLHRKSDQSLLDALFEVEAEWKKLRHIMDNSIDPLMETEQKLKLVEAKYMFLLREAKYRNVSMLRY